MTKKTCIYIYIASFAKEISSYIAYPSCIVSRRASGLVLVAWNHAKASNPPKAIIALRSGQGIRAD